MASLHAPQNARPRREHEPAGNRAVVEFIASYQTPEGVGRMHEISRFLRENGRWFYLDGENLTF